MSANTSIQDLDYDYPIELEAPDLSPYAAGTDGIPYVHTYRAEAPGPHVALTAVVHGNELCGAIALKRLLDAGLRPARGTLSLAFINIAAYEAFDPKKPGASRWVDEDFNRLWSAAILESDRQSVELTRARELRPFVDTIDLLLDIHSMQHGVMPLMMAGPTDKGAALAREVGTPAVIVADAGHAAGPRLRDYAAFADPASPKNAVLVECGQHWEAAAAGIAADVAARFLVATGAVPADAVAGDFQPLPEAQRLIRVTGPVTIRNETFTFAQPFRGMELLEKAGTLIGHDGDEPVVTPYDGCVLIMPSKRLWRGQTAVRLGRYEG